MVNYKCACGELLRVVWTADELGSYPVFVGQLRGRVDQVTHCPGCGRWLGEVAERLVVPRLALGLSIVHTGPLAHSRDGE